MKLYLGLWRVVVVNSGLNVLLALFAGIFSQFSSVSKNEMSRTPYGVTLLCLRIDVTEQFKPWLNPYSLHYHANLAQMKLGLLAVNEQLNNTYYNCDQACNLFLGGWVKVIFSGGFVELILTANMSKEAIWLVPECNNYLFSHECERYLFQFVGRSINQRIVCKSWISALIFRKTIAPMRKLGPKMKSMNLNTPERWVQLSEHSLTKLINSHRS